MKPNGAWTTDTIEDAAAYIQANKGIWIVHLVQYAEAEFGFMAHIPCEWCDYCDAEREGHEGAHEHKDDPYLGQKLGYIQDRRAYDVSQGYDDANALLDEADRALWATVE